MADNFNLINFKRGTLANLRALTTDKIEEGTFYLTIEEGTNAPESTRLFVGRNVNGVKKVVPVNQGIVTVSSTTDLDNLSGNFQVGDFAYIQSGNILAVRSANGWIQINSAPDDIHLTTAANTVEAVSGGGAKVTWSGDLSSSGGPVTNTNANFSVLGDSGVTVTPDATNRTITIAGDPATLASSAVTTPAGAANGLATISLTSTGNTASGSIAVKGGTNVTLDGNANEITISAEDTTNVSLDVTALDSTTHGLSGNSQSTGFEIKVTDSKSGSTPVHGVVDPHISILTSEDGSTTASTSFVGGTAALDVYSKDVIDEKFKALDGMKYKGAIGSGNSITTLSDISIGRNGDTYLIADDNITSLPAANSSTGVAVPLNKGDLLIVHGTENADGVIDATQPGVSITFDVVHASDDVQTYSVQSDSENGYGIKIHDNAANTDIGGLKLAQGSQITLGESGTNNKVVTIAHGAITTNSTTGTASTQQAGAATHNFNAITGITVNNGHVTGIETTSITTTDTNATIGDMTTSITATGNDVGKKATIETGLSLNHASTAQDADSTSFSLSSDNLTVTADNTNKNVTMNFVWGTF